MSYRRFCSPPVFLTYESIVHNARYSRSPSPSSDSEDDNSSVSDAESSHSNVEHQHVVGDMDIDVDDIARPNAAGGDHHDSTAKSTGVNAPSKGHEHGEEDEDEDEETKRAIRRHRAEKRKGKRPEQTPQQKAARRRARAEAQAEQETYWDAYRPILTIKSSQGFIWNQDLFIPAWQKDRYLCSTSPSSADLRTGRSPASTYLSSSMGSGMDYEVETVEIRIKEGEMEHIVPSPP